MEILGSKELSEQVLAQDLCTVCGACMGVCPYFKAHEGKVAQLFDCDLERGRCYAHCPKTGVDYDQLARNYFGKPYNGEALGIYRRITAAKAGEKMRSGKFQNGGTVSALMTLALESGLVEGAVLTDNEGLIPMPKLVTKSGDVVNCASTKYMAAPTVSCLNQAAADGHEKLGVVGTACQLTGVAQMRNNPLEKENFKDPVALTIGLFCTWALDTRKFLDFLSGKIDIDAITGMDVPPPPAEVFIIKTGDTEVEVPLDEIRSLVPNGCFTCPDMTAEWADLSVGAFEGKAEWNTLIIRTQRGEKLVEKAVKEGYLVLGDFPAAGLEHLTLGADNKKKRALEKAKQEEK
ncbi:MAG: Coenzyme F420 hydrogenase/dehydrogenase, beta subunit C-terminal domain [Deltaproteobacteria bacterium]|nr:Coenzyme F420 hydrogenase/dehydrogenase, beta subunit C-terminal domain [Deltaproteobacteria bacterium]